MCYPAGPSLGFLRVMTERQKQRQTPLTLCRRLLEGNTNARAPHPVASAAPLSKISRVFPKGSVSHAILRDCLLRDSFVSPLRGRRSRPAAAGTRGRRRHRRGGGCGGCGAVRCAGTGLPQLRPYRYFPLSFLRRLTHPSVPLPSRRRGAEAGFRPE